MTLRPLILNLLAVFGLAIFTVELHSEEAAPAKNPIAELIEKLPRQELLDKAYHSKTLDGEEATVNVATLLRACELLKQLRNLLKPGTSVFSYPGLLSKGRISYDGKVGDFEKYRLYMGIPPGRGEGIGETDFEVVFDEKGLIHEIKSVDWKH